MIRSDLSFQEIHNTLLAGQKLALQFENATEAESFRTRMHHHKAKQEETLEGLGFASEEDRTTFSFRIKKSKTDETIVAYAAFVAVKVTKKYPVLILEEKDLPGAEA